MHNTKYIFYTEEYSNIFHKLFLQLFPLATCLWMFSYNAWFPVSPSFPI